jgi:hypothetical protein
VSVLEGSQQMTSNIRQNTENAQMTENIA